MAETDAQEIDSAEFVVGLVPAMLPDGQAIGAAVGRIIASAPPAPTLLIYPPYAENGNGPEHSPEWRLIPEPRLVQDRLGIVQGLGDNFRLIFDSARTAGARRCAVIASDLSTVGSTWVDLLLLPAGQRQFDLIAPCYDRHPFEGMINRAIVYPLTRALYGKRIRNPFGPDFGVSSILMERVLGGQSRRLHPIASLAAEASTAGLSICQSHLGPRVLPKTDWSDLSSLLSEVLSPLFLDLERYAAHWQRARTVEAIPEFGKPMFAKGAEGAVEVKRLVESFALGAANLSDIWGMILPPSTLIELRKLVRQGAGAFSMPDEIWARTVYDFALAFRLRLISRDQMLRAMTPIYLGWVASYALELEDASPEAVEQRLERLCLAYEKTKPYFVARWRWPDRFNP